MSARDERWSVSGARDRPGTAGLLRAFVLGALVLVAGSAAAATKPAPPEHFNHAFRLYFLTEEKIEHLEWDAALGIVDAVYAELERALPELLLAAGNDAADQLVSAVALVRESIQAKDRGEGLRRSIAAELLFMNLVGRFSYRDHPVLAIIDADVREALERVEEGDLRHAAFEVAEVAVYLGTARKVLEEKRVPPGKIDAFLARTRSVADALNSGDAQAAAAGLKDLLQTSGAFLSRRDF